MRLRISRILLAGKPSACRGAGMCPACPPRSLLATACRGAGMCPACFLSTALPLRRLAQAQAQWMPMQLMKVRTPCTRAPYAMRVSHMHLRTLRTARLTCASAALRGASRGCACGVVNLHVARPVLVNTMTTAFDGSGNAVRRVPSPCDVCAFVAAATHPPQVHLSCGPTTWKRWCMCSCAAS